MAWLLQTLVVALVVSASFAYAAWALMPAGWRRKLARGLGQAESAAVGGCGACQGCEVASAKPALKLITVHRRQPEPSG